LVLAAGSVAILAAAATATASASYGLFRATTATETNTVASGTVTLTSDVAGGCSSTNLLPGTTATPCTLVATYSGTVSAYLGLDVLIQTQAGSGGIAFYNAADPSGRLQVTITDNQAPAIAYTLPTAATACPQGAPGGSLCYELDNELVSRAAVTAGTSVTFTTTVSVPSSSATGYQGGAAQVILKAHAVQSPDNGSTAPCTAGQTCSAVSWS
jgi:hypothetical protein